MRILVTGAAGFIGYHVSTALLARGDTVFGIDNLNAYYDPALKHARLARLAEHRGFTFAKLDITPGAPAPALVHVPIECLIEGDHLRAWVFVYDAATSRVKRRAVDVAFIDAGGDVALRSGVSPGETLVNAGIAYLRDGDQVQVHAS